MSFIENDRMTYSIEELNEDLNELEMLNAQVKRPDQLNGYLSDLTRGTIDPSTLNWVKGSVVNLHNAMDVSYVLVRRPIAHQGEIAT